MRLKLYGQNFTSTVHKITALEHHKFMLLLYLQLSEQVFLGWKVI